MSAKGRIGMPTWLHLSLPLMIAGAAVLIGWLVSGGNGAAVGLGAGFIVGVVIVNVLDGTRSNVGLIERRRENR